MVPLLDAPEGGGIPPHPFVESAAGWTWERVNLLGAVKLETSRSSWAPVRDRTSTAYRDLVALGCLAERLRFVAGKADGYECRLTAAGKRELKRVPPILTRNDQQKEVPVMPDDPEPTDEETDASADYATAAKPPPQVIGPTVIEVSSSAQQDGAA